MAVGLAAHGRNEAGGPEGGAEVAGGMLDAAVAGEEEARVRPARVARHDQAFQHLSNELSDTQSDAPGSAPRLILQTAGATRLSRCRES